MPIAFLDLLLEDMIQLSVHHTVPESDQLINFEDFTPWLSFCYYMTPCTIDAWFWLFFQSVHPKVLSETYFSESFVISPLHYIHVIHCF